MATKKYESMRIMSLEGSVLYKNEGFTATKDGKPDPQAFRGILDESLDTLKLAEVYDQHEREIGYPYLDGKKRFCRAVVNLSFNRAVKVYESYGNRYVLNGYRVTDEDMQDHVCVRIVNGRPTLIAIEVSFREDSGYAPMKELISDAILGKYFRYDADTHSYKRSDKAIPTDVTCQEIREHLYTHGFDIDGVHYVRYKRSAGASRDGRCLFIAEPLYADMMAWSSCGLSADGVADQASWQAYIALTLSSIESTIKLPKKSILIIRDRVSRFKADAVCVKETDAHDLIAEEEETEILLDVDHPLFANPENILRKLTFYLEKTEQVEENLTIEKLLNAFYKSLCFQVRQQKEKLEELNNHKIEEIYLVGGAVDIPIYIKYLSAALNTKVKACFKEATAIGNAVTQMSSLKGVPPDEFRKSLEENGHFKVYEPEQKLKQKFEKDYERFKKLVEEGK